jgi:hypothetical protein
MWIEHIELFHVAILVSNSFCQPWVLAVVLVRRALW